jgi:hypothetical protein
VFIGASPSLPTALIMAGDEAQLWCMARAKGLTLLDIVIVQ